MVNGAIPPGSSVRVETCRKACARQSRPRGPPASARLALIALLRRRVGLMGGGRFLDLLFEGRSDTVVDAIRAGAAEA